MRKSPNSPHPSPRSRSESPRAPYIPKNASPLQRIQAMRSAGLSLSGEEIPEEEDLTGLTTRTNEKTIIIHDDITDHLLDPHLPPPLGRTGTVLNLVASHNESAPTHDSKGKVVVTSALSPLNRGGGSSNKLMTRTSSSGRNTPVSPLAKQSSSTTLTPSPTLQPSPPSLMPFPPGV